MVDILLKKGKKHKHVKAEKYNKLNKKIGRLFWWLADKIQGSNEKVKVKRTFPTLQYTLSQILQNIFFQMWNLYSCRSRTKARRIQSCLVRAASWKLKMDPPLGNKMPKGLSASHSYMFRFTRLWKTFAESGTCYVGVPTQSLTARFTTTQLSFVVSCPLWEGYASLQGVISLPDTLCHCCTSPTAPETLMRIKIL